MISSKVPYIVMRKAIDTLNQLNQTLNVHRDLSSFVISSTSLSSFILLLLILTKSDIGPGYT